MVVVPVGKGKQAEEKAAVHDYAKAVADALKLAGLRVKVCTCQS